MLNTKNLIHKNILARFDMGTYRSTANYSAKKKEKLQSKRSITDHSIHIGG